MVAVTAQTKFALELDEQEARLLAGLCQNPAQDEDQAVRNLKYQIFHCIMSTYKKPS